MLCEWLSHALLKSKMCGEQATLNSEAVEAVAVRVIPAQIAAAFSFFDGQAFQGMTAGVTSSFQIFPKVCESVLGR